MLNESSYPTEYGSLPDGELKDAAVEMCKGKTIKDLRALSDYFSKKASEMSNELEKTVTMEDFEKIKSDDYEKKDVE